MPPEIASSPSPRNDSKTRTTMRRGLIARSQTELPDAVLDARLDRLRAAMAQARLDTLIVYTNNTRPAGVSWLTGFVPYWSEALLVVPLRGDPVLVVALTYRVKSWIERTSRVAEVVHTPRVGLEAGRRIAAAKADAAVGIVDFDALSAGIADDLTEGGPRLALSDASELFAQARAKADPAEIALTAKAASIAHQALTQVPRDGVDLGQMIAAVEAAARTLGAEEIYLAAAPDLARDQHLRRVEGEAALGRAFALRATVAYKGSWGRLVRTIDRDETTAGRQAADTFAAAVAQLPSDRGFLGFATWLVEGCRLAQPLDAVMGARIAPATPMPSLVSVQARIDVDGAPVLLGAPVLIGERGEAATLLAPCNFE
jgi:Xaa-Pro aminopeptidase